MARRRLAVMVTATEAIEAIPDETAKTTTSMVECGMPRMTDKIAAMTAVHTNHALNRTDRRVSSARTARLVSALVRLVCTDVMLDA